MGEVGGSVAKMLMGNVAGNAVSGASRYGIGRILIEVGEHTHELSRMRNI